MSEHNKLFHEVHPDVVDTIEQPCHKYRRLSDNGRVLEQWTENDSGELTDTTVQAMLEQEIKDEQERIAALERKIARQQAKDKSGKMYQIAAGTTEPEAVLIGVQFDNCDDAVLYCIKHDGEYVSFGEHLYIIPPANAEDVAK